MSEISLFFSVLFRAIFSVLASFTLADEPSDELTGKWRVIDDYGMPCIMVYAQVRLKKNIPSFANAIFRLIYHSAT